MRIFGLEITRRKKRENFSNVPQDLQTGGGVFYYSPRMTTGELLANATVNACVNIIADAVASLSVSVYKRNGGKGREKDTSEPLSQLLKHCPNASDTHFTFFQQVMLHLLLKGNAFVYVERAGFSGQILSLFALDPDTVDIKRDESGSVYYVVSTDHGVFKYTKDNILHIPAIRYNRLRGLSPMEYSAHAARTGLELEEYTSDYFGKGIHSKLIVTVSSKALPGGELTKKQSKAISDNLLSAWGGRENANKPLVTTDNSPITKFDTSSNEESQLVENRAFTEKEIAKIYRVPLFMLGSENSKFTNMEQSNTYFLQHTLTPWLVRIQEALTTLLLDDDKYVEFDTNTLVRADFNTRWANYRENFKNGLFTLNQIMDMENMPRVDSEIGDKHYMQAQYGALEDNPDGKEESANGGEKEPENPDEDDDGDEKNGGEKEPKKISYKWL